MSAANNGGPAFPRDHASDGHNGMTLLDFFAAKAMQGLAPRPYRGAAWADELAANSYHVAVAMLKRKAAIESAPELLEELQSALELIEREQGLEVPALRKALAAIVSALGGAS